MDERKSSSYEVRFDDMLKAEASKLLELVNNQNNSLPDKKYGDIIIDLERIKTTLGG